MSVNEAKPAKRYVPIIPGKRWDHNIERNIFEEWQQRGIYNPKPGKGSKQFVIDTPPPYPSGTWHIGAVAQYSQIDMIARTGRMSGFSVLFPIGIDRNGLPVEIYTENLNHVKMREIPREKFIELCRSALDELENKMIETMKRIGLSGDYAVKI